MSRHSFVILLAEPDSLTCGAIADMLKACGHLVVPVTTAAPALRLLDTLPFDVLVIPLDDHYSGVDRTLLETARRRQPHIKIVGMSTSAGATAGCPVDGFLHKPFDMGALDALLDGLPGMAGLTHGAARRASTH
jgi:CheY-like chemotaxis protein